MVNIEDLDIGNAVFAAHTLTNDGSMPGIEEDELNLGRPVGCWAENLRVAQTGCSGSFGKSI